MHTIVKFHVVIWFSFIVMHITNKQHNCATTSTPLFRLVVMFLHPFPLPLASQTCSIPPRSNAAVGCCVFLSPAPPPAVNQLQINKHDDVCPPPLFLLIIAPMQLRQLFASANKLIVMLLRGCWCSSIWIYLHAHHLCTSRQMCTTCESHQTISMVLMAKSAGSRRSPAMVEPLDGIGWLGGWFGGGAEAAGHGFGGWEGSKWARWAKK